MNSADKIQKAYDSSKKVGEGVYGVTKLFETRTGELFILKYFGKNYDKLQKKYNDHLRSGTNIHRLSHIQSLVEEEKQDAEEEKEREEQKHLAVYNNLSELKPERTDVICKPFKSAHKMITIQKAANTSNEVAMPLDQFMRKVDSGQLKIKRSILDARRSGKGVDMSFNDVRRAIGYLKADAFLALANAGAYHGDAKEDNIMVVYPKMNWTIDDIKLKIIDFGLGEVHNKRRLVTVDALSGKINYRRLKNLNERVSSRFPHDPEGIFGEKGLYGIDFNKGSRRTYMRGLATKYGTPAYLARGLRHSAQAAASRITRAAARSAPAQRTRRMLGRPVAPSLRLADIPQMWAQAAAAQAQSGRSRQFQNAITRVILSKMPPQVPPAPIRRHSAVYNNIPVPVRPPVLNRSVSNVASRKNTRPTQVTRSATQPLYQRTSPQRTSPQRTSPQRTSPRSSPRNSLRLTSKNTKNKGSKNKRSTSKNKGSASKNKGSARSSKNKGSARSSKNKGSGSRRTIVFNPWLRSKGNARYETLPQNEREYSRI